MLHKGKYFSNGAEPAALNIKRREPATLAAAKRGTALAGIRFIFAARSGIYERLTMLWHDRGDKITRRVRKG
jgi:hypothetical protein